MTKLSYQPDRTFVLGIIHVMDMVFTSMNVWTSKGNMVLQEVGTIRNKNKMEITELWRWK